MNRFYQKNINFQWAVAIFMFLLLLVIAFSPFVYFDFGLWKYLLVFIIVPLYSFLITPLFRLTGILAYKSPMLCVQVDPKKNYILHSGTSFDYFLEMRNVKGGTVFQNKILEYHLEGLLEIIREVEEEIIPKTTIIKGSSYFFSERTAAKMGFQKIETDKNAMLILILDYLEIMWMYSRAKGRLAFPKLSDMKSVEITGEKLVTNKKSIERLYSILKKRNTTKGQAIS